MKPLEDCFTIRIYDIGVQLDTHAWKKGIFSLIILLSNGGFYYYLQAFILVDIQHISPIILGMYEYYK